MHTSARLPTDLALNGLALRLAERRRLGLEVLDLTQSNPARAGLHHDAEMLRRAVAAAGLEGYEPDPRGPREVRGVVAAACGHGVGAEDLILSASTSEAYSWLFKLLGDPGDDLLVPSPSYPLFEWLARLEGLAARPVPAFRFERWSLDLEALAAACGPRTRAVVVVNPNNPTGQYLSRNEFAGLAELCARRGLALIVDEVFAGFPLEPEPEAVGTVLGEADPPCLLAVLSGLSKAALLPQMKLAWTVLRGPGAAEALARLEFIADQYLPLSAPVLAAAPALLALAPAARARTAQRLQANLAALDAQLVAAPAWGRLPVGGGWTVVLRRPALESDEAFAEAALAASGVLVHPGSFFGFAEDGHLVASLLTEPSLFHKGLHRMLGLGRL